MPTVRLTARTVDSIRPPSPAASSSSTKVREAALGDDPAAGKREAREALTVAWLVKEYIDTGEGRRSQAANGDYRRTLKAAVQGSPIGSQPVRQLARGDLRAFLERIARKTPIRANRVPALVRAAFRWGLREELIERDPTAGLQSLRPERRSRPHPKGSRCLAGERRRVGVLARWLRYTPDPAQASPGRRGRSASGSHDAGPERTH
jgi:hypothetical protein